MVNIQFESVVVVKKQISIQIIITKQNTMELRLNLKQSMNWLIELNSAKILGSADSFAVDFRFLVLLAHSIIAYIYLKQI